MSLQVGNLLGHWISQRLGSVKTRRVPTDMLSSERPEDVKLSVTADLSRS
jgi:hypothetical protein